MITVCLDWNCIIELEEDRPSAPALCQIREWYKQGKIVLCISTSSRMENHKSPDKRVYDIDEWNEKLHNIGLEGIELRESRPRAFLDGKGTYTFFLYEEQLLMREVHSRLFPGVDFMLRDYARSQNIKLPDPPGIFSLRAYLEQENDEQKKLHRKWNNRKNDALSIYAFGTWSGPDDVFVTIDNHHLLKNRAKLQAPYMISVPTFVRVPEDDTGGNVEERMVTKTFHNVIQGHIMSPQEAVEYLQQRLEVSP